MGIYSATIKNTKVIAAFPACGKSYLFEKYKNSNVKVLDSDSSEFSWIERKRTEEELEQLKKSYIDSFDTNPTLMSPEGYINGKKDEIIKERNPEFPQNYINHIKENIGKVDYIFVSTHESVRAALNNAGIDFIIIYPDITLKEEWVGRCFLRGSGEKFCKLIADNWDEWVKQLEREVTDNNHKGYILKHGEYLSDVLNEF